MIAPREAETQRNQQPAMMRPNQNQSPDTGRFGQGWSHPQVRPAPPVQQRNETQSRDDENKFRNWQQQRQQTAAPQNRPAPQTRPAPHQQENKPK
jgi:hypothetical protein